jgi:hypothetical protein
MKVQYKVATQVNGNAVHAEARIYEVHVNGEKWGWVSGPDKGVRMARNGWTALRIGAPTWAGWHNNRAEAVLAAL